MIKKNVAVGTTIIALLVIGLAFQNCTPPTDLSQMEELNSEQTEQSSPAELSFNAYASKMDLLGNEPVTIITQIISKETSNPTITIYRNDKVIGTGNNFYVPAVVYGDEFKVKVTDGNNIKEMDVPLNTITGMYKPNQLAGENEELQDQFGINTNLFAHNVVLVTWGSKLPSGTVIEVYLNNSFYSTRTTTYTSTVTLSITNLPMDSAFEAKLKVRYASGRTVNSVILPIKTTLLR